jgi:hypothetical protein
VFIVPVLLGGDEFVVDGNDNYNDDGDGTVVAVCP